MNLVTRRVLTAVLLLYGAAAFTGAQAAWPAPDKTANTETNIRTFSAHGCPGLRWHILKDPVTSAMTGTVSFTDGSGAASVTGSANPDGTFQAKLAPIAGKAPDGVLAGRFSYNGGVRMDLAGTGCSVMHADFPRIVRDQAPNGGNRP